MHRFILGFPTAHVDHVNGDGLDNRRSNLRLCTHAQNVCGVRQVTNKTGLVGVSLAKTTGKFLAYIHKDRKSRYLGTFPTAQLAAQAYNAAALQLFGEFARLNRV